VNKVYLSLEKNIEAFNQFQNLWSRYGIDGIRADTMSEGIAKAIELEKSDDVELFFIDIVADEIDFMPQLSILSNETNAPILIATSNPNPTEHKNSLNNGADSYGKYCETPEESINTVIAILNSIERRARKEKRPNKIIAHEDFLLVSGDNKVFIKDKEIMLTNAESEILYYFAINRGNILSHSQIYDQVSKDIYEPSPNIIYNIITRLRKKLRSAVQAEYIETVKGTGYRFKAK